MKCRSVQYQLTKGPMPPFDIKSVTTNAEEQEKQQLRGQMQWSECVEGEGHQAITRAIKQPPSRLPSRVLIVAAWRSLVFVCLGSDNLCF